MIQHGKAWYSILQNLISIFQTYGQCRILGNLTKVKKRWGQVSKFSSGRNLGNSRRPVRGQRPSVAPNFRTGCSARSRKLPLPRVRSQRPSVARNFRPGCSARSRKLSRANSRCRAFEAKGQGVARNFRQAALPVRANSRFRAFEAKGQAWRAIVRFPTFWR